MRDCQAVYMAIEVLDDCLRVDVSIEGHSHTPNIDFRLLVGLAGMCCAVILVVHVLYLLLGDLGVIRVCNWWGLGWWR